MVEDVRDMYEDGLSYYLNFTGDMIDDDGMRGYGDEDSDDEEMLEGYRDGDKEPRKPAAMPKKKKDKDDDDDSDEDAGSKPPGDK